METKARRPGRRLIATTAMVAAAAAASGTLLLSPALARSSSRAPFPSTAQQAQIFTDWSVSKSYSEWNVEPNLGEELGSTAYSDGTAGATFSYGRTLDYPIGAATFPQAFMAVGPVTIRDQGKSYPTTQLTVFARASASQHWKANTSIYLTTPPSFGPTGTRIKEVSGQQGQELAASSQGAIDAELSAVNDYFGSGASSDLIPDPAWYSAERSSFQGIETGGGTITQHSALHGFAAYTLRERSGTGLALFTFQMLEHETAGPGYALTTGFFPGQQVQTQQDEWYWTVAVADPSRASGKKLSVAGVAFAPISASGLTTAGTTIFFGPY